VTTPSSPFADVLLIRSRVWTGIWTRKCAVSAVKDFPPRPGSPHLAEECHSGSPQESLSLWRRNGPTNLMPLDLFGTQGPEKREVTGSAPVKLVPSPPPSGYHHLAVRELSPLVLGNRFCTVDQR